MKIWKKLSPEEIRKTVFSALGENVNYYESNILGIPASHLDNKVFYQDAPFLNNAPYLSTLIHNPNHIGCHTLDKSESFFQGTQKIERELIRICSEEIFKGAPDEFDGYVASGGTEANMQALWVYRNYFKEEYGCSNEEICIITSEDAHYSMSKAANVLALPIAYVKVDDKRKPSAEHIATVIKEQQSQGRKYFIVIANMMTTMFGSVDDIDTYASVLKKHNCIYKIHVDGAYGGFFYPFANEKNSLNFANEEVSSVTLDAHKMLQAPYGTGIFLIRKGLLKYANTKEAKYVEGEDFTLIGSRSGANAIAVWMILMTYGPYGWREKILVLLNRTDWLCKELDTRNVSYYRENGSNIVTIKTDDLSHDIAKKYGLVPDNHSDPKWFKIVIMEHVTIENLEPFIEEI
ncbi:pyridoxal phosphate-dependent decarboxylase family protein [Fulvivirga sediminis]|uniref:Aminotransferase class V-fold PLP-dependent enzyme n=1 Tax=Fulvivirga sediminis TaxID=2803949 RepID=A0A937F6M3_9BACT|nr:aminotransferase class V-fold PLP-dependent enzyme [Fulvivirga sediminis]MBL3657351.1 aminotransferase class V-fold PLP-dependent enzyme [Fulvivirga sediminis]